MHRIRITLIVVVLLAILAMATIGVQGSTLISLWFQTDVHGRPCEIHVYQVETEHMDENADAPCFELEWIIEVEELDDCPPTITPIPTGTMEPTPIPSITIQPSTPEPSITPTLEPYTGQYASLKTSDVYHKVTCSYLNGKTPDQLDYYATCEEVPSGKRACSRCKPCQ